MTDACKRYTTDSMWDDDGVRANWHAGTFIVVKSSDHDAAIDALQQQLEQAQGEAARQKRMLEHNIDDEIKIEDELTAAGVPQYSKMPDGTDDEDYGYLPVISRVKMLRERAEHAETELADAQAHAEDWKRHYGEQLAKKEHAEARVKWLEEGKQHVRYILDTCDKSWFIDLRKWLAKEPKEKP